MGDEVPFSRRHGLGPEPAPIRIRYDAPAEIRQVLLRLATAEVGLRPTYIREVLCTVLRRVPDAGNWSDYPNVIEECRDLLDEAPWYRVYDFLEVLYRQLIRSQQPDRAPRFADAVNEYFVEAGVGWTLREGRIEVREGEAFDTTVRDAEDRLARQNLPTAARELHEAIGDLSRRPEPDVTGAVHHAMGALECTAREVTREECATLGEILRRHRTLFPAPLNQALAMAWGYASDRARHVREGGTAEPTEARLIVGLASTACAYLSAKLGN